MSTRCVVRVKRGDKSTVDLYHHCEGYPEGVGIALLGTLERFFKNLPKDRVLDSETFINRLVKNEDKKLNDESYCVTTWKHGDLEFLYELDFGCEDELRWPKAGAVLKCWPLKFGFSCEFEDYDELKGEEINLFEVKTQIEAEEAKHDGGAK